MVEKYEAHFSVILRFDTNKQNTLQEMFSNTDRFVICLVFPPQKLLCEKLEEQLQNLDSALKKRERAERR